MSTKPQHILALSAENVKRISVVKIDLKNPTGNVVLTGANGQGKSSVLEAIIMALRGKEAFIEKPIREGADRGSVVLTTEDFVVKRRFQAGGGNFLEVTNREDAAIHRRPQEILDAMINTIGFDPIEFAQMESKEQAKLLLKICPTELDLEQNKAAQNEVQIRRRDINRDIERLEAKIGTFQYIGPEEQLVSIAALTKEISDVRMQQDAQSKAENSIKVAEQKLASTNNTIQTLEAQLVDAKNRKAEIEKFIESNRAKIDKTDHSAKIKELSESLAAAEETNERVRKYKAQMENVTALSELKAKAERDTNELKALIQKREAALKSIKFPVEGLVINDQGVVNFNGNPLSQCSTAEQIRVGVALAAASNPRLKVAFIKHGSLLDSNSIKLVAEIAQKYDMQVWIERVEDNSPEAIHIVDGTNLPSEPQEPNAQ